MTKCLLVNRNHEERRELSRLFQRFGFELSEQETADGALRHCRDNPPELVVMSSKDASESAPDIVRRLRLTGGDRPPVVLVYADKPDTGRIGRMMIDGAAECLVKPINHELLGLKLRQVGLI